MKERIIKYLGCPECNSDLELKQKSPSDSTGHIIDGSLVCKGCQNLYPIINGVPFFSKDLSDVNVDKNISKEISSDVMNFYKIVPFAKEGDVLKVGMVNPEDIDAREALKFIAADTNI